MTNWEKEELKEDCKEFLKNLFALFVLCAIAGVGARVFLFFAGF